MEKIGQLNVFEQQPGLAGLYTQICFCFSVEDESSHATIVDALTKGLERLTASFPWLAGQVVNEGSSEGNTGVFKIVPLNKIPQLVVKNLRSDPSTLIAPRNTLPGCPGTEIRPVLLLQANFITGGLLLTFVAQHNTMDMTGQGHLIRFFSKACHNEQFTEEEVAAGDRTNKDLVPLLDESYRQGPELARQAIQHIPPVGVNSVHETLLPPPKSSWAYFKFSKASLEAIKTIATKTLSSGFISTDDALSAFIWQSIIRARLPRLEASSISTFARAVDVRRFFGISKLYTGLLQNMTYKTHTLQHLIAAPLGTIASQLRSLVDPQTSTLKYDTRALATCLERSPDRSILSFTATINLSTDIMLSSWAKVEAYDLDFNLGLGVPECVRRPRFLPFESLLYLMPRSREGGIALAVCLREEDMERLRGDGEFGKYGVYVG
ncbi:putative trichothecene 3-O-acetyltransferase [Amylocarpus encephaloides]|uniref:Trichothecene 3-O-acetyltransferase n=1 Tax=Amylocarpus encephaloides TaxID=45428 RepID=A0A9P7YRA5_9HELO|nr:putative trichothecene 3-O-acetyltransferase [Amylocarpus encephaloides]